MVVVLGEAVDRRDILSTRCNMFATMHPGLARTLETQKFFGQQFFLKAIGGIEFLPPPLFDNSVANSVHALCFHEC